MAEPEFARRSEREGLELMDTDYGPDFPGLGPTCITGLAHERQIRYTHRQLK